MWTKCRKNPSRDFTIAQPLPLSHKRPWVYASLIKAESSPETQIRIVRIGVADFHKYNACLESFSRNAPVDGADRLQNTLQYFGNTTNPRAPTSYKTRLGRHTTTEPYNVTAEDYNIKPDEIMVRHYRLVLDDGGATISANNRNRKIQGSVKQ